MTSLEGASQLDTGGGWSPPKFTSLTIKYSASAISIAAPSVNANIFMTPLWLSSVNCQSLTGGGTVLGSDFLTVAGGSS